MKLHPPFIITSRLVPGLRIGDATLHLTSIGEWGDDGREEACFELEIDGVGHCDVVRSGVGTGFKSAVQAFHSYIGFLSAAAEAVQYGRRHGYKSDNADIFPPAVMQWADENYNEIGVATCAISDEDGEANHGLIED